MYPDKINLLDQFINEHCRDHKWIKYYVMVNQPKMIFCVEGPKNLDSELINARAQMICDSFDPNMLTRIKFVRTQKETQQYIKDNF